MLPDTLRPYMNTVVVALVSSAVSLAIGSMAAYALVRMTYRPKLGNIFVFSVCVVLAVLAVIRLGVPWVIAVLVAVAVFVFLALSLGRRFKRSLRNDDIAFWMVSQRILPPVVAAIPIYVMFQQFGMLDTHAALIITYMTVNLPIVVWLMYDFFDGIPRELEESASLDGASRYRIFLEIVLPLARAGLVATTLLVLILSWNEYLLALFLSTVEAQTMPLLVAAQNATRGPQVWYMSVIIIVMILPVIALTLFLQKFIAKGLLVGAVKG
jgi:multiple sugar transport system permease protein